MSSAHEYGWCVRFFWRQCSSRRSWKRVTFVQPKNTNPKSVYSSLPVTARYRYVSRRSRYSWVSDSSRCRWESKHCIVRMRLLTSPWKAPFNLSFSASVWCTVLANQVIRPFNRDCRVPTISAGTVAQCFEVSTFEYTSSYVLQTWQSISSFCTFSYKYRNVRLSTAGCTVSRLKSAGLCARCVKEILHGVKVGKRHAFWMRQTASRTVSGNSKKERKLFETDWRGAPRLMVGFSLDLSKDQCKFKAISWSWTSTLYLPGSVFFIFSFHSCIVKNEPQN